MAELPLLLFPSPEVASRTPGHGFVGNLKHPTAARQWQRLNPAFQKLQDSFNASSVELRQTPAGIDPEQALVIETVGNIENFANAVKKISGFEWMGEIEVDEIAPDEDFYDDRKPEKELNGRLYLVMSNQAALAQMLSLWNQYQQNTSMTFQYGLTKFRDVFLHLKDIRRWGVEDRLAEREIFEIWQKDLESDTQRSVRFEAELWYRESDIKRQEGEGIVTGLIQKLGGSVISQCVIPDITYHSVLGKIPAQTARKILEQPEVELIQCDDIMFFRPTGQMVTGKESAEGDISDCTISAEDLPAGDPVVAVLDGLPLENHKLLDGRLIVDDPDNWASEYPAIDRQHGTAMASLIVHGDLNDGSEPLSRPVYVRPIMKPTASPQSPNPERVPDDVLLVDYVHRAVKRIMEGEGDDEAAAPTVKIINLSVGDSARHFSQIMSPLARLLDWLSEEYNVLFVISSGNHPESIDTGVSRRDFETLNPSEREALIVKKIYEDARHRRLLSPAESINGLTVGAIHQDSSQNLYLANFIDPFHSRLPSPISPLGSGYRRSIKPDFIMPGGKVLYDISISDSNHIRLKLKDRNIAPGHQMAVPSAQPGELNKSKFCCGTSNSAALTSRAASICYDYLSSVFSEQGRDSDFSAFGVPILKAMLVHGCSWDKTGSKLQELLGIDGNSRQIKNWISRWIGYGVPDTEKALGCNEQRATLLGFGQLNDGEAHVYNLPLPPSLSTRRERRKFTVTLAWLSPVASTTQRYREAQLWFDFGSRPILKSKLRVTGIDNSDHYATRRGTIQHEVFEGESAVDISDGDTLRIKVNCRKDARKINTPIAYGLVVSLEVAEGVDLPIYNEVRTRIAPTVRVQSP